MVTFVAITAVFLTINSNNSTSTYKELISPRATVPSTQISGWIAWWKEEDAYSLIASASGKIKTVSPVWFMVDSNTQLTDIGTVDKKKSVKDLKKAGIEIYPSLGSEIPGKELGSMLKNSMKVNTLINSLVERLDLLGVTGLDVDLEAIEKKDRDSFTQFLASLHKKLSEKNLKMSVAIHAQTAIPIWEGTSGQNLEEIGKIADEVRIMLYDQHSSDTTPGPIASYKWMSDVVRYTASKIPQEKIVVGIPSYGYVWNKNDSRGLQFNEFYQALPKNSKYTQSRDPLSGELIITGHDLSGWLSDSSAMISKVNLLRELGFNKFIIWHLSGMDEKFFDLL